MLYAVVNDSMVQVAALVNAREGDALVTVQPVASNELHTVPVSDLYDPFVGFGKAALNRVLRPDTTWSRTLRRIALRGLAA